MKKYTGLKDKNNKPIKNGDKVMWFGDGETTKRQIRWDQNKCRFIMVHEAKQIVEYPLTRELAKYLTIKN